MDQSGGGSSIMGKRSQTPCDHSMLKTAIDIN